MTLTLWYHPFSSFCMKALIALYETDTSFDRVEVNLGDDAQRAAFYALWPIGKFPVLRDEDGGELIPESTTIIEYLASRHPAAGLIPADDTAARAVRRWDRFFDNYIHVPMQKIVGDRLRPAESRDPYGVDQARRQIRTAYPIVEDALRPGGWIGGGGFTLADCAAAPSLHYARKVEPWADSPAIDAYFDRLVSRPSFARVLAEAEPYAHFFPQE